jgi:hypothetical protein
MLSPGDPTTLKNIDRRSWELEAHALSIAPTVGWIAETLGYLVGRAGHLIAIAQWIGLRPVGDYGPDHFDGPCPRSRQVGRTAGTADLSRLCF